MATNASIIQKYSDWSGLQKLFLYLALAVVILGGYYYFVLDGKLAHIASLQNQIEKVDKEILLYRAQVAKLPEIKANLERLNKELYYAKTLLPEDAQALENLLSSFEKLGKDSSVQFLLFQPGIETKYDFYATRPVQLNIKGQFHHLMGYFDKLSRLDRLVSIQSINFIPEAAKNPTVVQLNTTLMLKVYRALTAAEIAAQQQQQKQKK